MSSALYEREHYPDNVCDCSWANRDARSDRSALTILYHENLRMSSDK